MNPRSTDCGADALTTTPPRRYNYDVANGSSTFKALLDKLLIQPTIKLEILSEIFVLMKYHKIIQSIVLS